MRIQKIDSSDERQIITGFIVSDQFLGRMVPKYEKDLFNSKWANITANWCVKYYEKYKKAPKKQIETIFSKWSEKTGDIESVELVERFLSDLSREYNKRAKQIDVDYLVDQAANFFNKVKLKKLKSNLEEALDVGDSDQAEKYLNEHRRLEMDDEEWINPFLNPEVHKKALAQKAKPLLRYQGPIGLFFGNMLGRDQFIGFQGPEKGGKSFWLQELCHKGAMQRLKVAFFGIGDMSQSQTLNRYQARLVGRPIEKGKYYYPYQLTKHGKEVAILPRRKKKFEKRKMAYSEIEKAREKFTRHHVRSTQDLFRMTCSTNKSLDEIKSRIYRWQDQENWTPDILAIDYADLLDPPKGHRDKLEIIDYNWRMMRALGLELHCLLVTATQVKRTAYGKLWQGREDTADNKVKAAHVTGMIGINFTKDEYEKETRRLNWAVPPRDGTKKWSVSVAGCYGIARPFILSC